MGGPRRINRRMALYAALGPTNGSRKYDAATESVTGPPTSLFSPDNAHLNSATFAATGSDRGPRKWCGLILVQPAGAWTADRAISGPPAQPLVGGTIDVRADCLQCRLGAHQVSARSPALAIRRDTQARPPPSWAVSPLRGAQAYWSARSVRIALPAWWREALRRSARSSA